MDLRPENLMILDRDYLSRDDLKKLVVGQKVGFRLPGDKLESAVGQCSAMRFKGMKFSKKVFRDGDKGIVAVERIL
jgi:hypothetical protein